MKAINFERSKYILLGLFSVTAGAVLLTFSSEVGKGVSNAIGLLTNSVIPSLFLFTALSQFVILSGAARVLGVLLLPLGKLLNLNKEQTTLFLMSMVSGYPVGARLLAVSFNEGKISRGKAQNMLLFCVNSGPAFTVSIVGATVLGSKSDGWRLLFATVFSAVLMAFAVGVFERKKSDDILPKSPKLCEQTVSKNLSDSFIYSVLDAAKAMLSVSAFVVLFGGVGGVLSSQPINQKIAEAVGGVLEVTVGVQSCSRRTLSRAAFLLGFGGISVIFQVLSAAKVLKPSLIKLLLSRLVHGILSAGVIRILELCFPRSISTVNVGQPIVAPSISTNPFGAVALLFLALVMICYILKPCRVSNNSSNL